MTPGRLDAPVSCCRRSPVLLSEDTYRRAEAVRYAPRTIRRAIIDDDNL